MLEIPEGTVRSRLRRGVEKLSEQLERIAQTGRAGANTAGGRASEVLAQWSASLQDSDN